MTAGPRFDLDPGTIVRMGPEWDASILKVERRVAPFVDAPSRLELTGVDDGQVRFMTDLMIAEAMRDGAFQVLLDASGRVIEPELSLLELDEVQDAAASRRRAYVDACKAAGDPVPRSRDTLVPIIKGVASDRGETPPGFTTVLTWIDRIGSKWSASHNGALAFPRNRGNRRSSVVTGKVAVAVAHVIITARRHRRKGAEARDDVEAFLKKKHPNEAKDLALPSIRTMNRRISSLDRFTADAAQFGSKAAERRARGHYEAPRPSRPLMEWECDHTPGDVLLCDDEETVIFGRSDIITVRDRCTGGCTGMSIGFDQLSYAAFVEGLRHAIYPKDMRAYPNVVNHWLEFGSPLKLFVDNALHFIGHNIRHAASQLNIGIVEMQPGQPWIKGAEEKMLGDLNRAVSHRLPGATFSNPTERKRYEEWAELPVVRISEYRAAMVEYICDHHNVKPHEGLGMLPSLRDVPRRIWNEKVGPIAALPPPSLFIALAGDVEHRCINDKGIRWDHIRYQSDLLEVLRMQPGHVDGRQIEEGRRGRRHKGTQYKVTRDPYDLGFVWVHNPHPNGPRCVRVPSTRLDYASGLTLHQHRKIMEMANAKVLAWIEDPVNEMLKVKREVNDVVMRELLSGRLKNKISRQ